MSTHNMINLCQQQNNDSVSTQKTMTLCQHTKHCPCVNTQNNDLMTTPHNDLMSTYNTLPLSQCTTLSRYVSTVHPSHLSTQHIYQHTTQYLNVKHKAVMSTHILHVNTQPSCQHTSLMSTHNRKEAMELVSNALSTMTFVSGRAQQTAVTSTRNIERCGDGKRDDS